MRRLALLAPILFASACADPAEDRTAPTLRVTSPERGTISATSAVTVTGESDAVEVVVAGVPATIADDGTFSAQVVLPQGIEVIETIARDEAGNEARDVRAVLSGNLAATGDMVTDAVGAHLGPQALTIIGDVVGTTVEGMDLAALAGDGPIVSKGGSCVGADVYLQDVQVGHVDVDLAPVTDALDTGVLVSNLDVTLRVLYRLACYDEEAIILVHADTVGLRGDLGMQVVSGKLVSSLDRSDITLTGFALTSDGLSGTILDLIEGPVEDALPGIVEGIVGDAVPPLMDDALADFAGSSWTVPVLGHDVAIHVRPRDVAMATSGVTLAIDAQVNVSGDDKGRYLSTPASATSALGGAGPGMGLAVADDTLNMMFAGMWAAGALEQTLPVERGNSLGLLLGDETRNLHAKLALPPTVAMDASGDLRLTIGDALIEGTDEAGDPTISLAISLSTTLGAEAFPDGHVRLRLGDAEVWAQVLDQHLDPAIEGDRIEALIDGVYPMLASAANQALAELPIPALQGISMVNPTMAARGGFLVIDTGLAQE